MTHASLPGVLTSVRRILRRRLVAVLALAAGAVVGSVLVLAWLFAGVEGWSPGTPVPLLLWILGGTALGALAWTILRRLRGWTGEAGLTAEVERSAGLPAGSVRAQAELLRAMPPGVSASLARAGEHAVLSRIHGTLDDLAGRPGRSAGRWLRFAGGASLTALALAAFLLGLAPERARTAWAGLASPAALLRIPPLPALELRPGDATLPRGSVPTIEVLAPGRDSVTLHWQEIGSVASVRTLTVREGAAATDLPPLGAAVRYWAQGSDGSVSAEYRLTPVDPSLLGDLVVEVLYPPHTRIAPEVFVGPPERLVLPEGTTLVLSGSLQGEGEEVALVPGEGPPEVRLPVDGGRFEGRWTPTGSARYEWVVAGGQEGAVLPPPLELEIVLDEAPTIEVPLPGADGELPLSLQVPVLVEASDDHGVAWIEIESTLRLRDGSLGTPLRDRIPAGDRPTAILRSVLDFSTWEILPGEEVVLRFRGADNAPVPHVVEGPVLVLRRPLASEVREMARDRIEEAAARTEELVQRAEREAEELRTMERQEMLERTQPSSATPPRDAFEEREELRQALERQAELAQDVEAIRDGLEEVRDALDEEEPRGTELQERIAELEALLEEVLGPGAAERLEELLESLRQGEIPESPGEILGEMVERQEGMQSRLESALERLRRSALEESMRGAEEEIRSMMETQTQLADSLAAGEGQDSQTSMAQRAEAMEERLSQLEERLRDGGDEEAADGTAEANRRMEEAREAMEAAADQSGQGNETAAAEEAQQAAEALEQALQQVEETRGGFTEEDQAGSDEALQRGAQSALALARRQAEVREAFRNAGPVRRSEFEGEETALMDGLRNLATELTRAAGQDEALAEQLTEAVGTAMQAVERTLDGLRRNETVQPGTESQAAAAQAAMQEVALLALSGVGGQAQGAPAAAGASAEDVLAELEALAQAQQSINRDARAMGRDPGSDGQTSRIEELARTQEAIASSLGELSREPGSSDLPGSLESLAEEAERIAEDLAGGRLEANTLDRQDQFLERLLAAGRTLERDGPTEEREATVAGAFDRRVVSPLPDYLLEGTGLPLAAPDALEALTPGQRRLVLDYFERIQRRQAEEGG